MAEPGTGIAVQDTAATAAAVESRPSRRWPGLLLLVCGTALAFIVTVLIGRAQEARGERILAIFDPLFLLLRGPGGGATDWLIAHPAAVAAAASAGLLAIALIGAVRAGRRAAPLFAMCAAIGLAVWGQTLLLLDHFEAGRILYIAAPVLAILVGWWQPMRRIPGFPPFAGAAGAGPGAAWQPSWRTELAVVFGLGLLALAFRAWALTELSDFFDLEMVDSMAQSRTLHGAAEFVRYTFLTTNPGAAHILPQWAIFQLFGTSIFTLRMAPVLWGVAAVMLMYLLVRRVAGAAPALVAALFMATAPDQLFWSRSENSFFSPVAAMALLVVNVGLWMVERLSVRSVVAAALCMPFSRYFYTTGLAMFLFPLAVAGHAVIFVRGAWRKLWLIAPILALGLVVWWFHLTVLLAALNDWDWRFRHPADIYGGPAWTRQGDFKDASVVDLVRLQALSMYDRMERVLNDFTYKAVNSFGHWYARVQLDPHPTTMNVGLVALLVVAVGYFIGQIYDPRAFALLAWLAIALLPGIMSNDAAPRRIGMVFLVAHASGAILLAAAVRLARRVAGVAGGRVAASALGIAAALVLVTNTVSHFRMPMQPVLFADLLSFVRPLVQRSDAIFLTMPDAFRSFIMFDNLEHYLATPGCFQAVDGHREWLKLGLAPRCTFTDATYNLALNDAEQRALQERYRMQRISFVIFADPTTQSILDLLRALYPGAESLVLDSERQERRTVAMTVDIADSARLRTVDLRMADPPNPPPAVLADVPLRAVPDPERGGTALIAGGILIEDDGWYRFALEPSCAGAELAIDGRQALDAAPTPMLAGVHPFSLAVPSLPACPKPLRITSARQGQTSFEPVPPDRITSSAVAMLPQAAAPRVEVYDGYAPAAPFIQVPGRAGDLAIGPDGTLFVAATSEGVWRIHRYLPDGKPLDAWNLQGPPGLNLSTIAVAPDGTVAALFATTITLYTPDGRPLGSWHNGAFGWESQLAFWGKHLLVTIPPRNSIMVFDRNGELVREFSAFDTDNGPEELYNPLGFAFSAAGDLVVLQPNGQAIVFRTPTDDFQPTFVRRFAIEAGSQGSTFDGPDRVLLPAASAVQVFNTNGSRLMAADPTRDPGRRSYGRSPRLRGTADGAYVLDIDAGRIWVLRR
ncbi:MAG: glycosyltransferase family 39 protein [Candidatus Binatia bacterium]